MQYFFFICLSIAILLSIFTVEDRKGATHTPMFILMVFLLLNWWLKWFTWPTIEWGQLLIFIASYLVVGVIWSTFKWFLYLRAWYRDNKKIIDNADSNTFLVIPFASNHKYDFSVWILWWPFSMLHWTIGSLLIDFIEWIISLFNGIYDRIGVAVLGDLYKKDK